MIKFLTCTIILSLFLASGCTTILRADFESEPVGARPAADIPVSPSGDRLFLPSEFRYGTVHYVAERTVDEETVKELVLDNRRDLGEPGWHTNLDGIWSTRFVSRPVRFPDRPIGTTIRGRLAAGSGRLDMFFGDEAFCSALRLRLENDRLFLLTETSELSMDLGEFAAGPDFSITTFVNRGDNTVSLFTAGTSTNIQRKFSLPDCARTSAWQLNMFAIGFVSPAAADSRISIDVVEMSENTREFPVL